MKRSALSALLVLACLPVAPLVASKFKPVDVPTRIQGSDRVVVASVADVKAAYESNEFGDQVIVTHVRLTVEEALKGAAASTLTLDLDGGTVDGVTLEVSSLPTLEPGDRAVFFLDKAKSGAYTPHLKGQGIVKLRADGTIKNSSLTLTEIRRMASVAGGR